MQFLENPPGRCRIFQVRRRGDAVSGKSGRRFRIFQVLHFGPASWAGLTVALVSSGSSGAVPARLAARAAQRITHPLTALTVTSGMVDAASCLGPAHVPGSRRLV
jgi:hypothetical protein